MKVFLLATSVFMTSPAFAGELIVGQPPPAVKIEGEDGAKVDGTLWSSETIKGKVTTLFYIDPDERTSNEPLEAAYKKEGLPSSGHQSIGIINMAATWLPNGILSSKLSKKQEEFPQVTYVKDLKKVLVSAWGLKDDAINVVIFDKEGKVMIVHKGAYTEAEIPELMKAIRAAL